MWPQHSRPGSVCPRSRLAEVVLLEVERRSYDTTAEVSYFSDLLGLLCHLSFSENILRFLLLQSDSINRLLRIISKSTTIDVGVNSIQPHPYRRHISHLVLNIREFAQYFSECMRKSDGIFVIRRVIEAGLLVVFSRIAVKVNEYGKQTIYNSFENTVVYIGKMLVEMTFPYMCYTSILRAVRRAVVKVRENPELL